MRTIIAGPRPPEIDALIERRRATGADLHDEVWDGEYHMAPGPDGAHGRVDAEMLVILHPHARRADLFASGELNIGVPDDYRVPDAALLRDARTAMWNPTAALVVEVLSPGDESWAKLGFYAAHDVDEVVIVDPARHDVTWLARRGTEYEPVDRSAVLDIDVADVAAAITWPPDDDL